MSVLFNNPLLGAAGQGPSADLGDTIDQSLRFPSSTGPSLSRTMGTGDSRRKFTVSVWVKRGKIPSADQNHIWNYHANPNVCALGFSSNQLRFYHYDSGGTFNAQYISTAVFRDPSAWYHIIAVVDTTLSTATDRVKLWVNGDRITSFGTQTTFSQNYDTHVGVNNYTALIGKYADGSSFKLGGYVANKYFLDGITASETDFGKYNEDGVWVPQDYTGTYGTNGFHLTFDSSQTNGIGHDSSGNGNHFTASGFDTGDVALYSKDLSAQGGFLTNMEPTYAFNGSLSDSAGGATNGGNMTFAPSTAITVTSSVSWYSTASTSGNQLTWNGTTVNRTSGWTTISGSGELSASNSFQWIGDGSGSTTVPTCSAIAIDGTATANILVDNTDNDVDFFDTPTSNYATLNPLVAASSGTFSNANLAYNATTSVLNDYAVGTMSMKEKCYWETEIISGTNLGVGISDITEASHDSYLGGTGGDSHAYGFNGQILNNAVASSTQATYTTGDIIGQAYDPETGKWWVAKNGTWQNSGDPAAGSGQVATVASASRSTMTPSVNPYGGTQNINHGQMPFIYTAPTGFKALQTNNLPEPTIKNGSDHFQAIVGAGSTGLLHFESPNASAFDSPLGTLSSKAASSGGTLTFASGDSQTYTFDAGGLISSVTLTFSAGNANPNFSISADGTTWTNLGTVGPTTVAISGQGNFRYVRRIDTSSSSSYTFTSNNGVPLLTQAQTAFPNGLYWIKDRVNTAQMQIVDTVRGVSLASTCPGSTKDTSYSAPSGNSVAWCWQSGEAATNGFNIITFTGNSSSTQAVAHGLPGTPEWIITASRGSSPGGFETFHQGCSSGKSLTIDSNRQEATSSRYSGVDATNITYGGDYNTDGQNMIAYAWTSIEGYSKFGTYIGNGSADGPFLYCGFKPSLIITKGLNITGTQWFTYDSTRDSLNPNLDDVRLDAQDPDHGTDKPIDFLSNGFKIRYADGAGYINYSGLNFVFMAFAESPFGGENAPPATAR